MFHCDDIVANSIHVEHADSGTEFKSTTAMPFLLLTVSAPTGRPLVILVLTEPMHL